MNVAGEAPDAVYSHVCDTQSSANLILCATKFIVRLMARYNAKPDAVKVSRFLTIRLTEAEYRRFKRMATAADLSVTALARRLLAFDNIVTRED